MLMNLHLQLSLPVYCNRDDAALCRSKAAVTVNVESLSVLTNFLFFSQFVFQSFNTNVTVVQEFKKTIMYLSDTRICELPGSYSCLNTCMNSETFLLNLHPQLSLLVYCNREDAALCWSKAAVTLNVETLSFLTNFFFLGQFVSRALIQM